jgi:hypothetical protein
MLGTGPRADSRSTPRAARTALISTMPKAIAPDCPKSICCGAATPPTPGRAGSRRRPIQVAASGLRTTEDWPASAGHRLGGQRPFREVHLHPPRSHSGPSRPTHRHTVNHTANAGSQLHGARPAPVSAVPSGRQPPDRLSGESRK